MSGYVALAKKWVEVTKLVAADSWFGIVCPKNGDADLIIEMRSLTSAREEERYEYWAHCPQCGAEIYFHSKDRYGPVSNASDGR